MDSDNEVLNNTPEQSMPEEKQVPGEKKAPKPSRKLAKWIVGGGFLLVLLAIALIVVGLTTGRLYAGFKNNDEQVFVVAKADNQRVVVQTVVCGDDIIKRANKLMNPGVGRDEQKQNFAKIAQEIKNSTDYAKDPSCQSILWFNASINKDVDEMEKIADTLEALNKDGLYASDKLNMAYSPETLRLFAESVKNGGSGNGAAGGN
ncbi:MAG: hypothetical protein LBQ11_00400 [Candidatus Nomurabacteria bacterium]|jgi:hypothetical protein|nr:hypothetical protein [Candidatus Nomurabacteria bacterium]